MKPWTWNGVGLLGAGVWLSSLGGCGENANDVGVFDDRPATGGSAGMGDVSTSDSSHTSSTSAGETESASSGSGGTGHSGGTTGTGGVAETSTGSGNAGGDPNTSTGTGGGGGAGGAGGVDGAGGAVTASGGSGGGDACPHERPADDSPCETDQLECPYAGDCGQELLVCTDGHWNRRTGEARTCASFTHETFPQDGDSCACTPELRCEFLDCDGRGRLVAQCNGDTWQVEAEPCEVRPCGPVTGEQPRCAPEQICVAAQIGPGVSYTCKENPCAHSNLPNSCECARSVCPSDAFECNMSDNDTVLECTCPSCQ